MKNRELLDSVEALSALASTKLKGSVGFAVSYNLKQVQDHLKVVEESRAAIVDRYTVKDDGKPRPVIGSDGKAIPGQVHIERPEEFRKEIDDLVNLDVTDLVKIRKLSPSTLDQVEIEPRHLVLLDWMFEQA